MKDAEFFNRALGLKEPWRIKEVKLDLERKVVELEVECVSGIAWGDETGQRLHIHSWEERVWRHLDTMQLTTVIKAKVPRVKYPDGSTAMVKVPWAEAHGRWTMDFERVAIEVLMMASSVQAGCDLLGLSWDEGHRIMKRAVERGLLRREAEPIPYLGIDEKSFRRGQDYVTVLNDLKGGRVLEVTQGASIESACAALGVLSQEQKQKVEAVAMDMSAAFKSAVETCLPMADVVHDRFHVSKMLNEAVDAVRREEHQALSKQGDDVLTHTRFLFLRNFENNDAFGQENLEALLKLDLKVARAWGYKEQFRRFWQRPSINAALKFFDKWAARVARCRLKPMIKVLKTLKAHLLELLNYFVHPITNALSEGLNSRIQAIKANARGFRNFPNYRTRILFFLGDLQLFPAR